MNCSGLKRCRFLNISAPTAAQLSVVAGARLWNLIHVLSGRVQEKRTQNYMYVEPKAPMFAYGYWRALYKYLNTLKNYTIQYNTNIFDYIILWRATIYVYNLEPITLSRKIDNNFIPNITIRGLIVTSLWEYIRQNRKLSITFNFGFNMYDKKIKSVTSHALWPLPLSQTVTPSRTPRAWRTLWTAPKTNKAA